MMTSKSELVEMSSFTLDGGKLPTGEPLYIRGEVRVERDQAGVSANNSAASNGDIQTSGRGDADARRPVLIVCHGFKGFKDWGFIPYTASKFAEEGFYVVTFNFSCNGVHLTDFDELDKFAVNTYSREQADLNKVLRALQDRKLPESGLADLERIYLLGHSRGGGNSILFAADHPDVHAVVTWNGIAKADLFDDAFKAAIAENGVAYVANVRTKQQMPIRAEFYNDLAEHQERYHITKRLEALSIPVLLIQGDQDSERLREGFDLMRQAAPQHRYVTIAGGTHTFGAVHPFAGTTEPLEEAIQLSVDFLRK